MTMNKVKDIYTGENGIFAIFANTFATDFAEIFGDVTAANLDGVLLHRHGNKPLTNDITTENAETVIINVVSINLQNWLKMHGIFTAQYNALTPVSETKTKTGAVQRRNLDTNENFDKVFNSSDFVGNEKSTNTGETTDTYNLTETRAANDNSAITDNVRNEFLLRQTLNLQNAIIETIINEITIKIY